MKKFLVILALILSLCMLCGIALAADDDEEQGDSTFGGISYEEAIRIHEIDGHEVTGEYEVIREATCSKPGIWRYKCATDESHFHELYVRVEHDWGEWKVTGNPCEGATETRVCKICGAKETKTLKAAHIWASDYNNPDGNWTDADKQKYSPIDLGMSSSAPNDISWGRVVTPPTCTEPGEAIDFCPRCGAERWDDPDSVRTIAPLGHEFEESEPKEVAPTCLEPGTKTYYLQCTRCGLTKVDTSKGTNGVDEIPVPVPVLEFMHDWDKWITVEAPTCYKEGKMLRWCKRCGDKQEKAIDPLDPEFVPLDARLVNCYTMEITYTCANCHGKDDKGNDVQGHEDYTVAIDVVAHTFIHEKKYLVEDQCVAATCTQPGKLVYKCIYDGVDYFNCPHTPDTDEYQYDVVELDPLGHDWNAWELRYDKEYEGQDNEYGYWLRDCKRCGQTEERISYYAPEDACVEHDFGDVYDHKDPTCDVAGYDKYICSICGHVKTEEIPALGHDFNVFENPATCTAPGLTIKVCNVCNKAFTEEIEALGHQPIVEEDTEASCLTDGHKGRTICEVCGEVLAEGEVIPAIGHHDYVKLAAVPATCTEDGLTEGVKCSVCGDELIAQEVVPALGHDIVVVEGKEPTCTEDGMGEGKSCSRCGEVFEAAEVIPALGHAWDEGEITKEAAPGEDGEILYTCTVCGETKTEAVPFEPSETPAYSLEDMAYGNNKITGTVAHDPTTVEAPKLYARVTVFFVGGTYAVFADYIEDGVIDIEVHGTVLAVSVELTGSKNVVPGEDLVVYDSWGEYYKD